MKKDIEDKKLTIVLIFFSNLFGSGLYYLNRNTFFVLKYITGFTILISIFYWLKVAECRAGQCDKEYLNLIDKELKPLKVGIFIICLYNLYVFIFNKDKLLLQSAVVMLMNSLQFYALEKKYKTFKSDDIRARWKKAIHQIDYLSKRNNFIWRTKIWFQNPVYVSLNQRGSKLKIIFILIIFIYLILNIWGNKNNESRFISVISVVFIETSFQRPFAYLIDVIFGLYIETTGICTGILLKTKRENQTVYKEGYNEYIDSLITMRGGQSKLHYHVYVTDFENKREIRFNINQLRNLTEESEVKVIHGVFSKKVIKINDFDKDFFM